MRTLVSDSVAQSIARRAQEYFEALQERIILALEEIENGPKFSEDRWTRPEGGGGRTRVIQSGTVFEKGGVSSAYVYGEMPESIARKMVVEPSRFLATGISLILHPRSPMIPAVHMNYRYFECEGGDAWFGGGTDLTPYYSDDEDNTHFHTAIKQACDGLDRSFYPKFKKWCDEYFYLKHRGESRGIGGIFFDYLRGDPERHFRLVRSVGDVFLDAYLPIVRKHMHEPWGEAERRWQHIRRGRYVEFNLVYDRGTLFGLETNGRVESILMSLPPQVEWPYNPSVDEGSREAELIDILKHPRDWAS